MIPQHCWVDNKNLKNVTCMSPQLIAEETEVQRGKATCSKSHSRFVAGSRPADLWSGVFPSQHMNYSSGNGFGCCCLNFSTQDPKHPGSMKKRSKDMVPSIKSFEISHFSLEMHADFIFTLYPQRRVNCGSNKAQPSLTWASKTLKRWLNVLVKFAKVRFLTTVG